MKKKILAIYFEELDWMYYLKIRKYFNELALPIKNIIHFQNFSNKKITRKFIRQFNLIIFFHRDPLKGLYKKIYKRAKRIEKICLELNIKLLNKPEPLSNSIKSTQLNLLKLANINVAFSYKIKSEKDLLKIPKEHFPIFLKNDLGHDSDNIYVTKLIKNLQEAKNFTLPKRDNFRHMGGWVAIQFIDTMCKDTYYRRYRVFATKLGLVPGNIYISKNWYVHAASNLGDKKFEMEKKIFSKKKFTKIEDKLFKKINEILNLDFSAIDYSINDRGEIIIWEANPHPAFPKWVDSEPFRTNVAKLLMKLYINELS